VTAVIDAIPAAKSKPRADYLALVAKFPLRAIHTAAQHDAALAVLEQLVGRDDLSAGHEEYLDALGALIETYEAKNQDPEGDPVSPVDMLRALMELREMPQADLARLLGSESAASMILNGKRRISRTQARTLANHFRVSVGVFI
jgi:HTH-type transcriptional regulator / antitoxin HigA